RLGPPDAAIVDYLLPDGNALDLMERFRAMDPMVPCIILTGHASIDLAVKAIKKGAEQFVCKPVELSALRVIVERAVETHRARKREVAGRSRASRECLNPFQGVSRAIRELEEQTARVVHADVPLLVLGETGTGKGVLARWIHEHSGRAREAFVDMNCAGFARELLETELFGHEKGAFTGAVNSKIGLFEVAHRGTMFLDEVGDMDPQLQPKLLKVLEEGRFRRLGDVKDREVDVRLIAATHCDLPSLVRSGGFRSDLYFRINTVALRVPALRERREDIPDLAASFLMRTAAELGRTGLALSPDAIDALRTYDWPGNVRELRNVIERAVLLCDGMSVQPRHLQFESAVTAPQASDFAALTMAEMERMHIERVLELEHGHVARAAERLGIPRSTLYHKLKDLALPPSPHTNA
ncbi:MAG: sigma-54-dependent transcriptional regulator, partial [Terriglobales bacterium]